MKRTSPWLTALTLAAGLTFSLVAAAKFSKTGDAKATFKAKGPVGLSIDGHSEKVDVSEDGGKVTIKVDLTALTTDLSARDEHLQNALETSNASNKYATFVVDRSALKVPADGASTDDNAKGKLTLHGTTKDVSVHYVAKNSGGTISVTGDSKLDMTEYGVKPPSFAGATVKNDVTFGITFSVKD